MPAALIQQETELAAFARRFLQLYQADIAEHQPFHGGLARSAGDASRILGEPLTAFAAAVVESAEEHAHLDEARAIRLMCGRRVDHGEA